MVFPLGPALLLMIETWTTLSEKATTWSGIIHLFKLSSHFKDKINLMETA